MGNSISRKRRMALAKSNKYKIGAHVVSLTSSSLNNLQVEFPKEIEEDLERRKIESFKALAAGSKKPSSTRASSNGVVDPAQEMYEKMRNLDVPAVMVPKPWSEVDQLLSKMKPAETPKKTLSTPKPSKPQLFEVPPETIDMWELMDDLTDEEADDSNPATTVVNSESSESPTTPANFTRKKIETLESSLSFSTIHTVKEVEGGSGKPETVLNVLRGWNSDSPRSQGNSLSSAVSSSTPRKVNINPSLMSRIEIFS